MLSFIVTEDIWRKGLSNYLTEMENKAADSDDLARGLQEAVDEAKLVIGADLKDIIDSWSLNAGLPVLHVSIDQEKNQLNFKQARYLASNETVPTIKNEVDEWLIPVTMISSQKPKLNTSIPEFWVKTKEATRSYEWKFKDWVLINVDAAGYYRVHYDETMYAALAAKLQSDSYQEIPPFSRTQLIDDALAFGKSDDLDYVTIFKLLRYLSKERNFQTWVTASNGLTYLNNLLSDSDSYNYFVRFVNELVSPLYEQAGIRDRGNTETLGDKRAREVAVEWACRTGDKNCIAEARSRLEAALRGDDQPIEPNLQGILECAALRQVSEDEFDLVWVRMQTTQVTGERSRLLTALGCTQNSDQQVLYLNSTIATGTPVPNYTQNERLSVLRAVYRNERYGLENAIMFWLQNYAEVKRQYPANFIRNTFTDMAGYVSSDKTFERFSELLVKARTEGDITEQEVTRYGEIAMLNVKWIENNENEIGNYFRELFTNGATTSLISTMLVGIALAITFLFK